MLWALCGLTVRLRLRVDGRNRDFAKMLEVNGTLLILVVSFLAFIWMLDMVFVTPVSKTLEARSRKIQEDLDNSKDLRKEAEAVLSQYEKHLAEVREKAQATINDAVGEAQKKRSEAVSKIQEEGRGRLDAAKASLASEKRSLVEQMVDEQAQLVDAIMGKLIGSSHRAGNLDKGQVKRSLEEVC